ncbi:unnamed protein product, partial [Polarella glacialis]
MLFLCLCLLLLLLLLLLLFVSSFCSCICDWIITRNASEDTVVRIVQQLVKFGHAKHPYLGVYLAPDHVTTRLSQRLKREGFSGIEGVLVLNMVPGSPADQAGLQPSYQTHWGFQLGDEIVALDGKKVTTADELMAVVEDKHIGDSLEVSFRRHQHSTNKESARK